MSLSWRQVHLLKIDSSSFVYRIYFFSGRLLILFPIGSLNRQFLNSYVIIFSQALKFIISLILYTYLILCFSCSLFRPRGSLRSCTRGSIRLVLYFMIWSRRRWNFQSGVQKASSRKLKRRPSMGGDFGMSVFLYFITVLQKSRHDTKDSSHLVAIVPF